MATTRIDDRDSAVVYSPYSASDPTRGWVPVTDPQAYMETIAHTQTVGATATLVFTGTSINVYGLTNPISGHSSSYTIDGGTPQVYNSVVARDSQYNVQYFASPQLPLGQHTLVVTALSNRHFYLDSFLISQVSTVTTAVTVNGTATTASASTSSLEAGGQSSTAVLTRPITSEVVVGSSTFTSVWTQTISSLSTSPFSATSDVGTSSSSSGSGSSSTSAYKTPLGPIVGGVVIGGIALLTIILALLYFFLRRNRNMPGDGVHQFPSGTSSGVTPFSPPPYVPPPNTSKSNGPNPQLVHGGSGEQLLASGRVGATFPPHLPLAQVTGKRQITAPIDRFGSPAGDVHQSEEQRLDGNAIPSSGTMGTSNENSNNTDVHQPYPMNNPEESPPPYLTESPRDTQRLGNAKEQ